MYLIVASLLVLRQTTFDQNLLHPALRLDAPTLERCWAKGYEDAQRKRNDMPFLAIFRRDIGRVRTSAYKSETVSWLHLLAPEGDAYTEGFDARRNFWDDQKTAQSKASLNGIAATGRRYIDFSGLITLMPSFTGKGRVRRKATPDELKDVHVVIKNGDHIYQPIEQPGDLQYSATDQTRTTRSLEYSQSQTTSNATVLNNSGQVLGTVSGSSTTNNYYTVRNTETYAVYTGNFEVRFDLFNPDGSARITPSDPEIEVIVVYGNNERHAKYNLRDLHKRLHE